MDEACSSHTACPSMCAKHHRQTLPPHPLPLPVLSLSLAVAQLGGLVDNTAATAAAAAPAAVSGPPACCGHGARREELLSAGWGKKGSLKMRRGLESSSGDGRQGRQGLRGRRPCFCLPRSDSVRPPTH